MRYLLDANTVIAAIRNHPIVLQHLSSVKAGDCALSAITRYELFVGVEKSRNPVKERARVHAVISTFGQVPFGDDAAEEAARVRAYLESLGTPIGPYDTLLAGHALALSLIVVTANLQEFNRVPGLTVVNWQV